MKKKIILGVIGVIVVLGIIGAAGGDKGTNNSTGANSNGNNTEEKAQADQPKQWVTVIEANGTANKKTASFELKGGQQKITYTFKGNDPYVIGAIYIMKEGTSKEEQGGIAEVMVQKAGTDETIARKSAGTYYLDVTAANASWTVKVEEER